MICDQHGESAVQGPSPYNRTYFSGLYCLLSTTLEFVACGGGWVVFWQGLKLSMPSAGSGASQEMQTKSAAIYALRGSSQHEQQMDLQIAAPCVGLEVAQERPTYEPRPAAASVRRGMGEHWAQMFSGLRDFINFEVWAKTGQFLGKATGNSLGGPTS